MARLRRWLGRLALLIVLLPLLTFAALFAALQAPPVQRLLAEQIGTLGSSPEARLRIGGIEGFVPFDFEVTDIALGDPDGVWLTVDTARVTWSPTALAGGQLRVDALTAGIVTLHRVPPPGTEPEPVVEEPTEPFRLSDIALPELPLAVRLDRLAVDEIRLGEPVLGEAAAFSVTANVALPDDAGGLRAEVAVDRLDEEGRVGLRLSFAPDTQQLALDLSAEEPSGGLVARAAALPGLPPVSLSLAGTGPVTDWAGRLQAQAGPDLGAQGAFQLQETAAGYALSVDLAARLAGLTDETLDPLMAEGVTLTGRVTYSPAGPIGWQDVRVGAAAGTLESSGQIDVEAETVDARLHLEAGAADRFAGLLPEGVGWSSVDLAVEATGRLDDLMLSADLDATGLSGPGPAGEAPTVEHLALILSAAGPLLQPALNAELTASSITAAPDVGIEAVMLSIRAEPRQPLDRSDTNIDLNLLAEVVGTDLGDPGLSALLQPAVTLTADGTLGLDGSAAPLALTLATPVSTLTADITAEDFGAEARGAVRLDVPQLDAFADVAAMPLAGSVVIDLDVGSAADTLTASLETVLTDITTGIPQADALLGARTSLTAGVTATPDGVITIEGLTLDAAGTRLESGRIRLDEALQAGLTIDLPDLSVLEPSIAGRAGLTLNATGPLDGLTVHATVQAEDLEAGGQSVPEATLRASASDLTGLPQGRVSLAATGG